VIELARHIAQDKLVKLTPDAVHLIARHSSHRSSHNIMLGAAEADHQTRRLVQAVRREHGTAAGAPARARHR
jgi:hypothetical protein